MLKCIFCWKRKYCNIIIIHAICRNVITFSSFFYYTQTFTSLFVPQSKIQATMHVVFYITLFCVILIHSLTHLLLTTNAKQNNIFNVAEKHNKHTSHYLIISGTRFCLSLSLNSPFYAFFFNEMQNLHY